MIADIRAALDAPDRKSQGVGRYALRAALTLLPTIILAVVLNAVAPSIGGEKALLHWLNGTPIIATAFGAMLVALALTLRPLERSDEDLLSSYEREGEALEEPDPTDKVALIGFPSRVDRAVKNITEQKSRVRLWRDVTGNLELSGAVLLAIGGVFGVIAWAVSGTQL